MLKVLRVGDHGPDVAHVRAVLASLGLLHGRDGVGRVEPTTRGSLLSEADARFDTDLDRSVRAFQQDRGLLVDGIVGPMTHRALREATYIFGSRVLSYRPNNPYYGDDIVDLQSRLQELGFYPQRVDGIFGPNTHIALTTYQRDYGLVADGICGPESFRSFEFLGTRVQGGSPVAMREGEVVRRSGPRLSGKRIVIDPGLGGRCTGATLVDSGGRSMTEADVLWDIAGRFEGRAVATGMDTYLSRPRHASPSESERASIANGFDADLMISLRCDTNPNPSAQGVATFHFGTSAGSTSMIGEVLSTYAQREIVKRTGFRDCRVHGRSWDLLRLTRMPTIQIVLGYVSNSADVAVLTDPRARDEIAQGILAAIKRLYLMGEGDAPTGSFTLEALMEEERRKQTDPGIPKVGGTHRR